VLDYRRWRTRDRYIVAFALAIAIHEVILALVRAPDAPPEREQVAATASITIETPRPARAPRPTPRPTPTVPPTPPPHATPPPHVTPAPVRQIAGRAKGRPARTHGGGAPHMTLAKSQSKPAASAAGAGAGTSSGNGSGTTPGAGGGQGGNGSGNGGNGNGAANADTPCGFVEFKPLGPPRYSSGTAVERIQAIVSFPDGHEEEVKFPYDWVYPNGEQSDPWSSTNLRKLNELGAQETPPPIALQTPPPGSDVGSYPPLVQYILNHSHANGTTLLHECPPQPRG